MTKHFDGNHYTYDAKNEAETMRLAELLAEQAESGYVLALDGDLGAGKTTFSKAFARSIGVQEVVNSPTFTIIKEYMGRLPFYHMDVYRIALEEAEELGLDDYFFGTGVSVVEWASRIEPILPEQHLSMFIENLGDQQRRFHLKPKGDIYVEGCEALQKNGVFK